MDYLSPGEDLAGLEEIAEPGDLGCVLVGDLNPWHRSPPLEPRRPERGEILPSVIVPEQGEQVAPPQHRERFLPVPPEHQKRDEAHF